MGGTQHPLSSPPDDPGFIPGYIEPCGSDTTSYPATGTDPALNAYEVAVVYPPSSSRVFGSTTFDDSVRPLVAAIWAAACGGACNATRWCAAGLGRAPSTSSATRRVQSSHRWSRGELMRGHPGTAPAGTNFILIANPMRPNGGILGRGFEGATIPVLRHHVLRADSRTAALRPRAPGTTLVYTTRPTSRSSTTSSAATHRPGHSMFWQWRTRLRHTPNCTAMSRTIHRRARNDRSGPVRRHALLHDSGRPSRSSAA